MVEIVEIQHLITIWLYIYIIYVPKKAVFFMILLSISYSY